MSYTAHEVLNSDLARALLNAPGPGGTSIWERLEEARAELALMVRIANDHLVEHPLVGLVADAQRKESQRRGSATVVVLPDGSVAVEYHYKGEDRTPNQPRKKTGLPSLAELRSEAKERGLDPTPYGQSRKKLAAALDEFISPSPPPSPPKKVVKPDPEIPVAPPLPRIKTAPALTKPQVVVLDEHHVYPLADEDEDLSGLFGRPSSPPPPPAAERREIPEDLNEGPPLPLTPRRAVPRIALGMGPPSKLPGVQGLQGVVDKAEQTVDLNAILTKPAPKPR